MYFYELPRNVDITSVAFALGDIVFILRSYEQYNGIECASSLLWCCRLLAMACNMIQPSQFQIPIYRYFRNQYHEYNIQMSHEESFHSNANMPSLK